MLSNLFEGHGVATCQAKAQKDHCPTSRVEIIQHPEECRTKRSVLNDLGRIGSLRCGKGLNPRLPGIWVNIVERDGFIE